MSQNFNHQFSKAKSKSLANFRLNRNQSKICTTKKLIEGVLKGDTNSLSKAITTIESTNPKDYEIATEVLEQILPHTQKSIRIGITGTPGVGKSTFIEAFVKPYVSLGKKVAVLAIDPSSTLNKGSILGDKVRMEHLTKMKNVFIRPSPSGDSLGGVARKTQEAILLCEAAGYNIIIVETVGVGQNEVLLHTMVDFFLLLKMVGMGDEIQGIKRGIMEITDAIIINKIDKASVSLVNSTKKMLEKSLHAFPKKESNWTPKVLTASAYKNEGIEEIHQSIQDYVALVTNNNFLQKQRNTQKWYWFKRDLETQIVENFYKSPKNSEKLESLKKMITENKITPFKASDELLNKNLDL